jgi:hypothetical protein
MFGLTWGWLITSHFFVLSNPYNLTVKGKTNPSTIKNAAETELSRNPPKGSMVEYPLSRQAELCNLDSGCSSGLRQSEGPAQIQSYPGIWQPGAGSPPTHPAALAVLENLVCTGRADRVVRTIKPPGGRRTSFAWLRLTVCSILFGSHGLEKDAQCCPQSNLVGVFPGVAGFGVSGWPFHLNCYGYYNASLGLLLLFE